jgi:diguanylate cyclase (GGDEF)-like protein
VIVTAVSAGAAALALAAGMGGLVAIAALLRARADLRAERLALRLVREREATMLAAAHGFTAAAAGAPADVRAAIDRAIRALAPAIDAVAIFEERDGALCCIAATGPRIAYFTGARIAIDDPRAIAARALLRGRRVTRATEFDVVPLHPADAFSLAVPLSLARGLRGAVVLGAPVDVAPEAVEAVVQACNLAAPAYAIALEREADRARAEFDGLTGLLTPRAFRERFTTLAERCRFDPRGRLALLFVDIDHFKTWNDTFGHASGDALLRAIAAQLRDAARDDDDLIARNGGDEFCLAFPAMDKAVAIERAAALCEAIARADRRLLRPAGATAVVAISASIGVAAYPADASDASALLEGADAAMYASKRGGRDRVSYRTVGGPFAALPRAGGAVVEAPPAAAANPAG